MKTFTRITALVGLLAVTGVASAHTTSIGYVPGANAGEVTFYTGTYGPGHSTFVNEGTLTLTGATVTYGPVIAAFNIAPVATKPTGLVDGTTNFYWNSARVLDQSLTADPDIFNNGGVIWWQGVTFAGLNPGTYDFTCGATCGTTATWDSLGSGTGTVTLAGQNIGGGGTGGNVPEPGALALLGIGLFGAGMVRRRNRKLAAGK